MTPRFAQNARPTDHISGIQPMSREDARFWKLRRERATAKEETK